MKKTADVVVRIYVNNYGWILGRDNAGKIHYTRFCDGAKEFESKNDKEFISYARQAENEGHHIDAVYAWREYQ